MERSSRLTAPPAPSPVHLPKPLAITLATTNQPSLLDLAPQRRTMLEDVLQALAETPKRLPSKYFYDSRGSELFDAICETPEYYPTRTELGIMDQHAAAMARQIGPRVCLIELGSGSGSKTRHLLSALESPLAYVPIDIAREHLVDSAVRLAEEFPGTEIAPVCADFLQPLRIPELTAEPRRRVVYFPGSTLGNLTTPAADELLNRFGNLVRDGRANSPDAPRGGLLLGVDLQKEVATLEAAYNDAAGLTAQFNLNLLDHLNSRLDTQIPTDAFRHEAPYVAESERIEMRLVATRRVEFTIADHPFVVEPGERIVTEYSHKYAILPLTERLAACGWEVQQVWTDPRQYFAILYAETTAGSAC